MRHLALISIAASVLGALVATASCTEPVGVTPKGDAAADATDDAPSDGAKVTTTDAAPTTPVTLDDACDTLAAARCGLLAKCAPDVGVDAVFGTLDACESRVSAACRLAVHAPHAAPPLDTGADAGDAGDSGDSGDSGEAGDAGDAGDADAAPRPDPVARVVACAEALSTQTCDASYRGVLPDACAPAAGDLSNGAACGASTECASGICTGAGLYASDACGTCAAPADEGGACTSSAECASGLACAGGICRATGANAECNTAFPCGAGFTCVTAQGKTLGTCTPTVTTAGAACDPAHVKGPDCERNAGLTCGAAPATDVDGGDAGTGACTPIRVVTLGPCGTIDGVEHLCKTSGTCSSGADAGDVRCHAAALDGQPCHVGDPGGCIAPATCVATAAGATCTLPAPSRCAATP